MEEIHDKEETYNPETEQEAEISLSAELGTCPLSITNYYRGKNSSTR
jgi:hypothetical protein